MTCGQETLSKSCRVNSLAIWNYDTSFVPLILVKQNMKMRNAHCRKFTKKHALIYHDKPGVSGFVMPCRLPWQSWLADDKLNLEGKIKSRPGPFPMTGILNSQSFVCDQLFSLCCSPSLCDASTLDCTAKSSGPPLLFGDFFSNHRHRLWLSRLKRSIYVSKNALGWLLIISSFQHT